jgi:hypothetical protein
MIGIVPELPSVITAAVILGPAGAAYLIVTRKLKVPDAAELTGRLERLTARFRR